MAARSGMVVLIGRIRSMIGDPAGADQVFSDDEIQYAADVHRWEKRYAPLKGLVTYTNGVPGYLTWVAAEGNWESDAVLSDAQYGVLTPSGTDAINGRWTFAASQAAVYITGWFYDLFGAAADLLEAWAAKTASDFDFTADGASFHRSQKGAALRVMAEEYRKKQRVHVIQQERGDLRNDY